MKCQTPNCKNEVDRSSEHRWQSYVKGKPGQAGYYKEWTTCGDCCPNCNLPPALSPEIIDEETHPDDPGNPDNPYGF